MITCRKCGEGFQEGMRSCPYCGQKVESDSDASSVSYIKSFDSSKYTKSDDFASSENNEYQMVLNNARMYYIFNIILWVAIAIIQVIIGIPSLLIGYGFAVLSCAVWNIVISIIMIIFMKERFSSLENAYNYYYNRRIIAFVLMFVELFLGAMIGAFGNLADVLICRYVIKNAERIFNERNKNSEANSYATNNENKQILLQEKKQINVTPGLSIESYKKRINLFIEDEKWDEAYAYSEAALDVDATNYEVYLLKTLIEYKVTEVSLLSKYKINDSDNYKKYLRFGGTPLEFEGDSEGEGESEVDIKTAKPVYEKIEPRKLKIQKVEKKEIDFESLYNEGIKYMQEGQEYNYRRAIQCFFDADEYKDSKEKIVECRNKIEELRINKLKEQEEKKTLTEKNKAVEKTSKIYKIIYIVLTVFWGLSIYLNVFSVKEAPVVSLVLLCPEAVFLVVNIVCFVLSQKKVTQKCKKWAIVSLVSAGVALIVSFIFVALSLKNYLSDNTSSIYNSYSDIKGIIQNDSNSTEIEDKTMSESETILLGQYEQDSDETNGKEDIEWEILQVKDNMALVISKYALDYKKFNDGEYDEDVSWEKSSIRKWLNNDFYDESFNDNEKEKIILASINNIDNYNHDDYKEGETNDRVFLLSIEEIVELYGFQYVCQENNIDRGCYNEKLICTPTKYALKQGAKYQEITGSQYYYGKYTTDYMSTNNGAKLNDIGYSSDVIGVVGTTWWLRSRSIYGSCTVSPFGEASRNSMQNYPQAIRPAMYIEY